MKYKVITANDPVSAGVNGATAGLALAALTLPQKTVAIFPDQQAEFIKNLPRPNPYRVLLRGALGHAAFFTVYEGLMKSILKAKTLDQQLHSSTSSKQTQQDPLDPTLAATRFLAGGVSAIVYKAATMGLANGVERPEVSLMQNAKHIGRSFALGGAVMAVGGVLETLLSNQ
jgi:hypothetical protein